jgi:glycosyltransferase involved in cell wall biosynthesis
MRSIRPGLVVVEGLQTALTDAAIECAAQCGLRVLLVSHGVSVHPFDGQPADQLRALAWTPYRLWRLPRLIGCLAATTTLAEHAVSTRFHDRDLARAAGIPVLSLRNFAVHWQRGSPLLSERRRHVLVVGYFSRVKNQLAAIDTLPLLPPSVRMRFIGPRFGRYVKRCMQRVRLLGLVDRVDFLQDNECSIADEVASAAALLSTSLTEALPITLLEAMASGTPYVATEVGAVGELGGGTLAESAAQRATALRRILDDPTHWQALSAQGQERYATEFSRDRVASQLTAAVTAARLSP